MCYSEGACVCVFGCVQAWTCMTLSMGVCNTIPCTCVRADVCVPGCVHVDFHDCEHVHV